MEDKGGEKEDKKTIAIASNDNVIILLACERICFDLTCDTYWVNDTSPSFHAT